MTRLAIIHTTPATIDTLKALATELLPGADVINFVDDSILPELGRNGGDLSAVVERLIAYTRFAEQADADVILEACSSVGELVTQMQAAVNVPVVRIDSAMAEAAVRRGPRIGVAATLPTTLNPTTRLLRAVAQSQSVDVAIQQELVSGAYQRLMVGDRDGHDALIVETLMRLSQATDVVVLAQASMARVLPRLSAQAQGRILTSPRLAMERVKAIAEGGAS